MSKLFNAAKTVHSFYQFINALIFSALLLVFGVGIFVCGMVDNEMRRQLPIWYFFVAGPGLTAIGLGAVVGTIKKFAAEYKEECENAEIEQASQEKLRKQMDADQLLTTMTAEQQPRVGLLPVEDRYHGSRDGFPDIYLHQPCGNASIMPEEQMRSYLADPTSYSGASMCTGCGAEVPATELIWVDTGENVAKYIAQLKPIGA